jgi:hypothetical protein
LTFSLLVALWQTLGVLEQEKSLVANFQFEQDIMIQDSRAICYMLRQPSPVKYFLELSFLIIKSTDQW